MQLGVTFLLNAQDQSTHRWDVDMDAYTSYHATMVASQALLAHSFRGYGPGLLGAVDVLDKWRAADCPEDLPVEHPDAALLRKLAGAPPPSSAPPPPAARAAADAAPADGAAAARPSPKAAARPSPKAAAKPSPKAAPPAKKRPLEDAAAAAAPEKKKKAAAPKPRAPSPAPPAKGGPPPPTQLLSPPPKAPSTPKAPPMPAGDVEGINGELAAAVTAQDYGAAIRLVKRLNDSHITVGVMKSTSIGKTVAELKKAPDKKLAMAAKALVASWKQAVRDAEK